MQNRFLTAKQVSELLQLNVETVYDLISTAGLPAAKIGGCWRFDEQELREWFKTRRSSSPMRPNTEEAQ